MRSHLMIGPALTEAAPRWQTPCGPVWQVGARQIFGDDFDADSGGSQYLVRRLPPARSMLRVGPLLAGIAQADHPRLWGPGAWSMLEDGLWIATQVPRGVPLIADEGPRLSWGEAMELWRPVAEAVERLQRQGLVHGSIAGWNTFIDRDAQLLTVIDAGCWVADDLAAIPHSAPDLTAWLASEMHAPPDARAADIRTDIYGLARLLCRLTLTADQALAARPSFTGLPAYAIPAINAALSHDPAPRPARVRELIAATSPQPFYSTPAPSPDAPSTPTTRPPADDLLTADTASILYARVSQIEQIEHPKFGPGIKFYLSRYDDSIGAFFYQGQDPELFDSIKWVWEGCELNLLDARVIQNSGGQKFLTAQAATLPVLEPHMLMSVSAVRDAQGCASRFLVDQRDAGDSSRALVLGNLVHGLLDDLVAAEPPTFDVAYDARLSQARLDMLAAGLRDTDLAGIYKEARLHFDNIQRFTAPRTHQGGDHDRVGWSGRHVEVTRYSTRYGIEGRVDLVAQDPRDGLQIVELKSGKTWGGHISQVRMYRFLWEGLAKSRDLEITGHLLYSKVGSMQPVRMEDVAEERRILRARNELIACLRGFVDPDYPYQPPYYLQFPQACRDSACNFRRKRCALQTEALGLNHPRDADQLAKNPAWAWHRHFERLIELERWASSEHMGAVLNPARLAERKANFSAIDGLQFVAASPAQQWVEFRYAQDTGESAEIFYPGDYVLAHHGDFEHAHILRGRVIAHEKDAEGSARITISTAAAAIAPELRPTGWIMDKMPARLGFRQAHHAIFAAVAHSNPERRAVLFHPHSDAARDAMTPGPTDFDLDPKTRALNPGQQEAVRHALGAPAGALIQGPPGTGKTTVIAHTVRELVARQKTVLLSAFTNNAVDTILQKLLDVGFTDFVRVGSSEHSPDLVRALVQRGHDVARFFSDDLAGETVSLDLLAEDLLKTPVLASTAHRCVGSATVDFLRQQRGDTPFDVAIVDEAGQITEPMTLAAINLAERFVLVGDHRQLPPIVENEAAHSNFVLPALARTSSPAQAETLRAMGLAGLEQSLFERLISRLPHVMLSEQYRMHPQIMAFSSRAFYDDKLSAHDSVLARSFAPAADDAAATRFTARTPRLTEILDPGHALVFVDVDPLAADPHETAPDGLNTMPGTVQQGAARARSRTNPIEARALVETVAEMLENSQFAEMDTQIQADATLLADFSPQLPTIGVISPFRAQVQLIRAMLHQRLGALAGCVDVDTVERFQGGERDIVLVSFVKTVRAGDFLSDARRLNVTLTRACQKLVLFGNHACLVLNPLYRQLLAQPETHVTRWSD